jgi:hypothetical protein
MLSIFIALHNFMILKKFKYNYTYILINIFLILNLAILFTSIFFVKYAVKEFILFAIISIAYFYYSCLKFRYYSELYLGFFIYLGFYFKSTFILVFNLINRDKLFPESAPFSKLATDDFLNKHLSELFNISSVSIATIFLTFYIFNNFISYPDKKYNEHKLETIKQLFSNYKLKLYLIFSLIAVLLISLNLFFLIVTRGLKYQEFSIAASILRTFLFFGFYLVICIFLELEKIKKNINWIIFFNIILGFFISISIYSRAMIIDQLVIYFSAIYKIKNLFYKIILLLFIISFSLSSIVFVNSLRTQKWKITHEHTQTQTQTQTLLTNEQAFNKNEQAFKKNEQSFKESFKDYMFILEPFRGLFVNRWIGIDGLSNVVRYKEKNLNFYLTALKEEKKSGITFYERIFFSKTTEREGYSSSALPGFIAFSYYSGSIFILIMTLILFVITIVYIERIINYFSMNLTIVKNYLVFLVVWRVVHFGAYPVNTVYYFLLIIFLVFCFFLFNKILNKYYDK